MSPRFATQPPRLYHRRRSGTSVFLSFLIHRHLTPSLLSSSRSFPPILPRVFCSCLPAKHDQSLFPVRRHDTPLLSPFTPTAILEEGLLRQRQVFSATGRMCDHPSDDYREIAHVGLSCRSMNFIFSHKTAKIQNKLCICEPMLNLAIYWTMIKNFSRINQVNLAKNFIRRSPSSKLVKALRRLGTNIKMTIHFSRNSF